MKISRAGQTQGLFVLILLLALALRVIYFTHDRFHADEALYAGWALRILDDDPLLLNQPVDKPPLFLYALAGAFKLFGPNQVAARWINLACSMIGIALVYHLSDTPPLSTPPTSGKDKRGIWAALFLACSPFDILFARTAFTDSLLVMWWLAALVAAARGRWSWAGLLSGLAFAAKQHAVMLIPLVWIIGIQHTRQPRLRFAIRSFVAFGVGFLIPWGLVTWWDAARWAIRPGYWDQSFLSYGGLRWAAIADWPQRLVEWLGWARYLTGGWGLGLLFVAGTVGLAAGQEKSRRSAAAWVFFILGYIIIHIVLNFSIWDRYLLPLAAPVALLGAQGIAQVQCRVGHHRYTKNILSAALVLLAALVGLRAAFNGYPIGGEHWAYQGIDEIAAYLKDNARPGAALYHHWLRWHYSYYLHGVDLDLRWWRDGAHLRREACRTAPTREQYIVLPDWRPLDPAIAGVRFEPILQSERLTLYRVVCPRSRRPKEPPLVEPPLTRLACLRRGGR